MKNLKKVLLATIATISISAMLSPTVVRAQEGNENERPNYTTEEVNSGALGNTIVFNSISDSQLGEEWDFVRARNVANGATDTYHGDTVNVEEDGTMYRVFLYVHNDNPSQNAISENTRVSVTIPESIDKELTVSGTITSDNAIPSEYHDGVTFKSDHDFHLEYVYGSDRVLSADEKNERAYFCYDITGDKRGLLNGYNSPDGKMPGGPEYGQFICFRVVAVFHHECEIKASVRMQDTEEWQDRIVAKVGDEVEYQIRVVNTGSETISNVSFLALSICPNLEYLPDTAKYYTSFNPEPKRLEAEQVDGLFSSGGANLGDCPSGSEIVLVYTAKVINVNLKPGENPLGNWIQIITGEERCQKCTIVTVWRRSKVAIAIAVVCHIAIIASIANIIRLYRKLRKKG